MKTRILTLVTLILVIAMTACACIAEGEVPDSLGIMELENGIVLTFDSNNWKVDVDENGDVAGASLASDTMMYGFSIVDAEETDAEAYAAEGAEAHETDLIVMNTFAEELEWNVYTYNVEDETSSNNVAVFTRANENGAWIVTFYSIVPTEMTEEEAEFSEAIGTEMMQIMDSLSFSEAE